jgi:hypothetical protein
LGETRIAVARGGKETGATRVGGLLVLGLARAALSARGAGTSSSIARHSATNSAMVSGR